MSTNKKSNLFVFNEKIDSSFLFSLYEDDYAYMEEIFSITVEQLALDVPLVKTAFEQGQLADLQKSVHKLKPSFGFVGLTDLQQECKLFEDLCRQSTSTQEVSDPFAILYPKLEEARTLVAEEQARLQQFNQSAS